MQKITGSLAFLSLLKDEGISYIFGNPGTTELPIMAALSEQPDLTYVLGLQEAVVVAMADGFSRASGKLSACNVHVAPGLGNAMGSLFNAKWFGSPVLVTAGQHEQGHGLTEPQLYDPLIPIASPMVKWAVEVNRAQDLPRIVRRAAKIALTPPTGPVFISLPGDILKDHISMDMGHPTRIDAVNRPSDSALEKLAKRILEANRPLIIAGHELSLREALDEASKIAELLGTPVYQQTVPYTAQYLSEHTTFMGALSRIQSQVSSILKDYDLLICLGSDVLRMSVWNVADPLPDGMPVIQIGERDWELGKNYHAEIAIKANIKETLNALLPVLKGMINNERKADFKSRLSELKTRNWNTKRKKLINDARNKIHQVPIDPQVLMMYISETLPKNAVLVEECLTTSKSLLGFYPFRDARCYYGLASGGIGFAIAGAIGIHLAQPERPLVALIGDGSSLYNIQALWTAVHLKLPLTYIIANNKGYRILKDRLLEFQRSDNYIGMNFHEPEIDFVNLAKSFGMNGYRITHPEEIRPTLQMCIIDNNGPNLIEVMIDEGLSNTTRN